MVKRLLYLKQKSRRQWKGGIFPCEEIALHLEGRYFPEHLSINSLSQLLVRTRPRMDLRPSPGRGEPTTAHSSRSLPPAPEVRERAS